MRTATGPPASGAGPVGVRGPGTRRHRSPDRMTRSVPRSRPMPKSLPKVQRVAAYGLILRDNRILLTRLARRISADQRWHLPGGGVDHGEDPRDALVREIREETGLSAEVGETARVYSAHLPSMWRKGRRWDSQALRILYDAWVPV